MERSGCTTLFSITALFKNECMSFHIFNCMATEPLAYLTEKLVD